MDRYRYNTLLKIARLWIYFHIDIPVGYLIFIIPAITTLLWDDSFALALIPFMFLTYLLSFLVCRQLIKRGKSSLLIPTGIIFVAILPLYLYRFSIYIEKSSARTESSIRQGERIEAAEKLREQEIKSGSRKAHIPLKATPSSDIYTYEGKTFHFQRYPDVSMTNLRKNIPNLSIRSIAKECSPDLLLRECQKNIPGDRVACYEDYGHKPDYPNDGKGNWVRLDNSAFYVFSIDNRLTELWHIACLEVSLKNP